MIYLKNGCYCSEPSITPANWDTSAKSIKKGWQMHYRFYDPLHRDKHPKGKQVLLSAQMNRIKDYEERKQAARGLLKEELSMLKERDYNPITGLMTEAEPEAADYVIHPESPLCDAWQTAYDRMSHEENTLKDVRSVMKYCKAAAVKLRLDQKPIKDIARRHIILILEQCGRDKATWTDNTYNWYRSNLMMLFDELEKVEAVAFNPVEKVEKKAVTHTKPCRVTLTDQQRKEVNEYLQKNNFRFWLFVHIFFHSGSRETEILRVQGKQVNLERQEVSYLVKKGRVFREVVRPIKGLALHLWQIAMLECGPDQYVFSEGLIPGARSIRPEQLTRRWRRWVKNRLGIVADLYSLKHLNTTEMSAQVGTALAALHNRHSEDVLIKHYDMDGEKRQLDILKNVDNSFAPKYTA